METIRLREPLLFSIPEERKRCFGQAGLLASLHPPVPFPRMPHSGCERSSALQLRGQRRIRTGFPIKLPTQYLIKTRYEVE
jgi:hypothetical protein